ncbi:hypothetical protein PG991_005332 [Apiospora marii]|uniref:Dienelactone hydrolase n=1 Tax=Apiospora marii TaxID=335849 RepID=A0ABR1S992_9PEZI
MFDVPKIVNAALPESERNGRTLNITGGSMAGAGPNHNDPNFLSDDFPKSKPKLYITAEEEEFDELTIAEWRNEGYDVEYFSMGKGGKEYKTHLRALTNQDLGPCETFGIIAYGEAASICLEFFHVLDNNPSFKLCCLIAYYPTAIPDPRTRYPGGVHVLVHLAEGNETVGIVKQDQMVGIQGKRRTVNRKIPEGMGTGKYVKYNYPTFSYDANSGFAEQDLEEYDKISADLAWSRSLATTRRAWRRDVNLERVHEENVQAKYFTQNLQRTMSTYTKNTTPYVTFVPTQTGGIGADELHDFYGHYFLHRNPGSLQLTLLSRTVGTNRVVDELHVAFKHTTEMPWILPGVPPTKKKVEVLMVSIVTVRGGKLAHEYVYWDQASVLMQVGLLDPALIPDKAKRRGVTKLPVVGREVARRRLDGNEDGEDGEADNHLIPDWYDDDDDEDDDDEEEGDDENGNNGVNDGGKQQQNGNKDQKEEEGEEEGGEEGEEEGEEGEEGGGEEGEEEGEEGNSDENGEGDEEGEQSDDDHEDDNDTRVEQDKAHHSDEEPSRS